MEIWGGERVGGVRAESRKKDRKRKQRGKDRVPERGKKEKLNISSRVSLKPDDLHSLKIMARSDGSMDALISIGKEVHKLNSWKSSFFTVGLLDKVGVKRCCANHLRAPCTCKLDGVAVFREFALVAEEANTQECVNPFEIVRHIRCCFPDFFFFFYSD